MLRLRSGGLFSGSSAQPIGAFPHIPGANARIAQLTGVEFGDDYNAVLEDGTRVMDSTAAATGLVALRRQAPERALDFAGAIQKAWYQDGKELRDVQVYREIAEQYGLDADAVAAAFEDPEVEAEALEDFRELRRMGVQQYPTLLIHTENGIQRLGGPVSSAEALTQALDAQLAKSAN